MSKYSLLNNQVKKYAYYSVEEIFNLFNISKSGLKINQVFHMRKKYGKNLVTKKKVDTIAFRFKRAFLNPFTIILFLIAIISVITDIIISSKPNPTTSIIIIFMILISGTMRLYQEVKAKKAADRLEKFINTKVVVKREGILVRINSEDVVVGDIVVINAGDKIPADIRIINSTDLFVSQAAITGESSLVEKKSEEYDYDKELQLTQYNNLAFMGTSVVSGKGEGIVISIGSETVYGNFILHNNDGSSSFYKGANSIAWVMVKFMIILVPIVFIISGITKGNWIESLIFSLSVAIGLTPEMLPMVVTTCLAKGGHMLSKKKTIVKNINAMQGFGSMDVLCMDKTGTITNESIVLEYYMDIMGNENIYTLELAYLNSYYHSGTMNPIDKSILECSNMPNEELRFSKLTRLYNKLDEIPFDFERKLVSILVEKDDEEILIVKGEVNNILVRCTTAIYNNQIIEIDESSKKSAQFIVDDMYEDGMKVIAVAKRVLKRKDTIDFSDECNLTLVGFIAFFDAPKKTAKTSIDLLRELGVKAKILTGDSYKIAESICKRVSIQTNTIITGEQLNEISDTELFSLVKEVDVFAELTPSQKVRVVSAIKQDNLTVGFLGDGINDIPALCESDVAISVDTAVDSAKDISDVILLEKDLNVLAKGIVEGRKTFTNMLKYIKITASSNFGNIFAIVCASAFIPFLPMTAVQLLLLNVLYDILCMVLPWDNVDEEECKIQKKWSGDKLSRFMGFFGPISSIFDIATFMFLYFVLCPKLTGGVLFSEITDPLLALRYIAIFQTGWFLESMWTQVLILHMLRTRKTSFIESKASKPVLIITILGIITFTVLTFLPVSNVLGMTVLPLYYFIFLFIIVTMYLVLITVAKKYYIRKYNELI